MFQITDKDSGFINPMLCGFIINKRDIKKIDGYEDLIAFSKNHDQRYWSECKICFKIYVYALFEKVRFLSIFGMPIKKKCYTKLYYGCYDCKKNVKAPIEYIDNCGDCYRYKGYQKITQPEILDVFDEDDVIIQFCCVKCREKERNRLSIYL